MKARTRPTPKPAPVNLRARLYVVLSVLALASTALMVRAVDLQVVRKDFYQEQGDARYLRDIPIAVSRGTIFDRNGEALAVSTPVESIWANPPVLLENADRLPELARALGLDQDSLSQKLAQRSDKEFVYLKRHLNPDDAAAVLGLEIPGVASQREFRRYYPNGEVAAHVLGFTNIDDRGQEGLELAFDDWLAGKPGVKRVIRDRLGHIVENVELLEEAQPGRDLTLSIDRRIQYLAYRELMSAIREHGARSGSMVVLDVATGEILAMVNQPSFNPNSRGNVDVAFRRNRAVTDVVEPGSTMKAFTITAALESGKWTPTTKIDTNPGTLTLYDGRVIRDVHNVGLIDVTHVITKSSNVGAAKIAQTLSRDHMYDVYHRFGFGEVTGCGFPGESPGFLPVARKWGPVEQATIAYGYGVSVTPLQLAQAYAAIAAGGILRQPTFVKGARNPETAIVDPAIAASLRTMLETVVTEGSGTKAAVTNYHVAGKTGTSRMAAGGGYANSHISLFAGMVPATRPRLVGVVVIHDPQGVYYGGLVAAPVFSKVMDGALRLLDVPPDDVQNWYTAAPRSEHNMVPPPPAVDEASELSNYAEGTP
jgi:cell division protein FtsI (penicillin-binding protein 3)